MVTIEKKNLHSIVSWSFSLVIHLIIVIFLLLIRVFMQPEIPEYSEMDFVSVPTIAPPAYARTPEVSTPPSEETSETIPEQSPENLALPKMRHLPDEQPELIERNLEKVAPTDKPYGGQVEPTAKPSELEERYPLTQAAKQGEKPLPQARPLPPDTKPQSGSGEKADDTKERPYTIEGAVSARQVITEVLPEYPLGLNKEAVIKIRFTLLPNGTVGNMVPLQKGEATLEEITMKAFRRWRFNPLPPDIPQVSQAGVITFRYLLK